MTSPETPRPRRADAQRNRDAILGAARITFETEGIFAPLDGIATKAGIGNATLYRNFPTRDDLLAAVIQDNLAETLAEASHLRSARSPRDAFAEWLFRLAWQLRIWHGLPTCVATAIEDTASPVQLVSEPLLACTQDLLASARAAGATSADITAREVFELIIAISWGIDRFGDDAETARRRVALATTGFFTRT